MLNIVIGTIITLFMFFGIVAACLIGYYNLGRFRKFPYEIFGMSANALIGIVGFSIYMTYLPVTGHVIWNESIHDKAICKAYADCDDDVVYLGMFGFLSSLRFITWYFEFLVSFCFIMIVPKLVHLMTLLRYIAHCINTALSLITFILAIEVQFPRRWMLGSGSISPVIIQSILLMWVIMSFWFISQSSLYRQPCTIQRRSRKKNIVR